MEFDVDFFTFTSFSSGKGDHPYAILYAGFASLQDVEQYCDEIIRSFEYVGIKWCPNAPMVNVMK